MPSPTPANKVLTAAQEFAREKFGATHRYATVLHTDQQHPHVHLVVKAEDERGKRLRIDKAKLREWREDFAQHVRDQGVAANATSRFERGLARPQIGSKEYRAIRHGRSRRLPAQLKALAREFGGDLRMVSDPAHSELAQTRESIVARWNVIAEILEFQGEATLAADTRQFAKKLPAVLTNRELLAKSFIDWRAQQEATKVAQEGAAKNLSRDISVPTAAHRDARERDDGYSR